MLGPDICDNILIIHALLGCDTMSLSMGSEKDLLSRNLKLAEHSMSRPGV